MTEKIILQKKKIPISDDIESDIEWLCESLGLIGPKDKDKTGIKIFRVIIECSREGRGISSSELCERFQLSKTAVVYHLNNLIRSGVVERRNTEYYLRERNILRTIMEIKHDIERIFTEIEEMADIIDRELNMPRLDLRRSLKERR